MNLKIINKIKEDKIISLIRENSLDDEIYLVGGVFRDFWLDNENFDKDIAIKHDAKGFAEKLANTLDATFIPLDEENKIYRLVLKDKLNYIDIAEIVGDSIEDDLKRRDLTINSVAINLKTLEIIDVTGGIEDLKAKKIRHIWEQNFVDDPLRLLRAFRFQAQLGFELDSELVDIIKKHADKISKPSIERINFEILKLFAGNFSEDALFQLDSVGLLEKIFPVINELKKVPKNTHHHLDLFEHSIETVKQVQIVFNQSSKKAQEHLLNYDFGGATRLAHLKFAAFLHDIGKFSTWTIEEETGKHRFIKHDDVGSKMAAKILKAGKFSKKQIEYITKMIKYHIYPSHVVQAPEISDKIYMRLIRKMENDVVDVITLAKADRLSARGVEITDEIVNDNLNRLDKLLDFYLNVKEDLKPLPKLLSGEDIMEILNIKPSKELGTIIKALQEAQISGDINTKEEAIDFVLKQKM